MKRKVFDAEFVRKYGILMVLVIMWVVMLAVSPTFRTVSNAINILRQVAVNGILAIGMTFVIMPGGIDLTVGSLVAVAGVISGSILVAHPDQVIVAVLAGIVVCGLFGAMNGFFVAVYIKFSEFQNYWPGDGTDYYFSGNLIDLSYYAFKNEIWTLYLCDWR